MDTDATTKRGSHGQILSEFKKHNIDILIGTQMIAKGHDFPRVTLVGVVSADTALNLPDFRAAERTFQLVTQVAGRAGRQKPGRVVVQAFDPDHPALRAAAAHDYQAFVLGEIEGRRQFGYPPFGRLTVVTVAAKDSERAMIVATALRKALVVAPAEVLGPAVAPLEYLQGQHRVQLVLKTRDLPATLKALREALASAGNRRQVRISVDVDAVSML